MLSRLVARLRRGRPARVWVRLSFEDGPPKLLGPMDRFSAEIFVVNRINPTPFYDARRVTSTKIIPCDDA